MTLSAVVQRAGLAPLAPAANATLLERREVASGLAVFRLALDVPLASFRPGQYVSVGVSDGARLVQRPYSITALGSADAEVELFIRHLPSGALSGLLWQLPIGARVHVGPAKGLFTLDPADSRRRLFVAGGTGVAPFLAMLAAALNRPDGPPALLIHGVSHADELVHAGRIERWRSAGLAIDYRPTVSRPGSERSRGWTGLVGRAEAELLRLVGQAAFRSANTIAYLCGNADMVEAATATLRSTGMAAVDIHAELFHRDDDTRGGTLVA